MQLAWPAGKRPEEYLAWEREQETKHEYLEGQVSD